MNEILKPLTTTDIHRYAHARLKRQLFHLPLSSVVEILPHKLQQPCLQWAWLHDPLKLLRPVVLPGERSKASGILPITRVPARVLPVHNCAHSPRAPASATALRRCWWNFEDENVLSLKVCVGKHAGVARKRSRQMPREELRDPGPVFGVVVTEPL